LRGIDGDRRKVEKQEIEEREERNRMKVRNEMQHIVWKKIK
jgi:hypothetical protein